MICLTGSTTVPVGHGMKPCTFIASGYTRTAFVHSGTGVDGAQALNDPALPFLTAEYAAGRLYAESATNCTIQFQDNYAGTIDLSAGDLTNLYSGDYLTLKGYGSVRTLTLITLVDASAQTLTLDNITVTSLTRAQQTGAPTQQPGGTIHGIGTVVITTLSFYGGNGTASAAGAAGVADDQSANIPGKAANDTIGTQGTAANASGGSASAPGFGGGAWTLTLTGAGTITNSCALYGGVGGANAIGGVGATATASIGGEGGDGTGGNDGAAGGVGGTATSHGGSGSTAGNGGNGANLNHGAWTLSGGYSLAGGAAGTNLGGAGAVAGTTNTPAGGQGGAGDPPGNQGAQGASGTPQGNAGSAPAAGSAGSAGTYS